jgi:hypothetical protein
MLRPLIKLPARALLAPATLLLSFLLTGPAAYAQIEDDIRFETSDGPTGTPCDTREGLPCDRTPPHLANRADPVRWSRAGRGPDGILFRRATRKELEANVWPVGSFLIDGRAAFEATRGAGKVTLVVPLDDARTQEVVFEASARVNDLEFIERSADPDATYPGAVRTRILTPTLYEYFNEGFNPLRPKPVSGAWGTMIAGDDGGFFATGLAAGFEFEAGGPGGWTVDDIPAPGGLAPNPANLIMVRLLSLGTHGTSQYNACQGPFGSPACDWLCAELPGVPCGRNPHLGPPPAKHCIDGGDNDGDGKTDSGDEDCQKQTEYGDNLHPGNPIRDWESGKSYALFGEGRFCTRYANAVGSAGNWIQRLTAVGWKAEALINDAIGFQGVLPREKQVRYRGGACWVFPSPEAAAACNANGSQCLNEYPYANSGASSSQYYGRVWNDVHHAMSWGLKDALHMAQVVHWGGTEVALSCAQGQMVCCGAAMPPGVSPGSLGSSVVQYEYSAGAFQCSIASAGLSSAHEFGHTVGLDHNNLTSFMKSPAYDGSSLPPADKALLVGCMESWNCPRPSGFRWIP